MGEEWYRTYTIPEKERGRTYVHPHYLSEKAFQLMSGYTNAHFYQMFVSSSRRKKTCIKFEN